MWSELLIAMPKFLDVLCKKGMVILETDGHWLHSNSFIVCWLPYKVPSIVLTWLIYTNTKFELLLNLLQLIAGSLWYVF